MRALRIVALVVTLVSLVLSARLELSKDMTALFPRTREADAIARVTRALGGGDVSMVLLRGEDADEVERAADEAVRAMKEEPSVATVVTGPPAPKDLDPTTAWRWAGPVARKKLAQAVTEEGMRARLRETRALLLAPGASEAAEYLARDPLRLAQIPWEDDVEIAAGARATPGNAFVADGGKSRLFVVEPKGRAFESAEAASFTDAAEAALDVVRRAHPTVTIEMAGGHVIARQTESMMQTDMIRSSILSTVLAAAVFALTFRRTRALLAVLPPLAAGTAWTTAIASLSYPRLSAVATAFAAVVVGVGVDTGVHVYGRLLAARRRGLDPATAADVARKETAKPTLGAAIAAGAAFACLALSDVEGMRQLGVLCAIGEVLTAVAILLFVPEIGAWLERGAPPPERSVRWLASITATRGRSVAVLAAALAIVATAVWRGVPTPEHGVLTLDTRAIPALATYDRIYEIFGGTRGQLVIVSTSRERADALAEAAETLLASGTIAGYDAVSRFAPSAEAQKARFAERDALDLPSRREILARALEAEGFAPDAFGPALEAFAHPSSEIVPEEAVPEWLRRRHVATDEQGPFVVTYVRLRKNAADDAEARATLRAADPTAVFTGFAELESALGDTLARDLPRVLLAAIGMVVFVLGASLRRPSRVALAVLVLVVEIAIVMVVTRWLGVRWHVYDALVLPVLLGITLDEALFLLEAAERRGSIEAALAEQAPLGAATALTTAAGFAALGICRFAGLVDIGKVGSTGSVAGLVCAVLVIPAAMRLLALGKRAGST